jgi:hypothetical protein
MTTLTIHRSLGRRVFLADRQAMRLIAEDWPTDQQAEEAASLACIALTLGHTELRPDHLHADLDRLANSIMRQLAVDDTRPYGCALLLEPA